MSERLAAQGWPNQVTLHLEATVPTGKSKMEEEEPASCWLCWEDIQQENAAPALGCACKGDLTKAHTACMVEWLSKNADFCPNCRLPYCYQVVDALLSPRSTKRATRLALKSAREELASGPPADPLAGQRSERRQQMRDVLMEHRRVHAEQRRVLLRAPPPDHPVPAQIAALPPGALPRLHLPVRTRSRADDLLVDQQQRLNSMRGAPSMLQPLQPGLGFPLASGAAYFPLHAAPYLLQPAELGAAPYPPFNMAWAALPPLATTAVAAAAPQGPLALAAARIPAPPSTGQAGGMVPADEDPNGFGPVRRAMSLRTLRSGALQAQSMEPPVRLTARRTVPQQPLARSLELDDSSSDSEDEIPEVAPMRMRISRGMAVGRMGQSSASASIPATATGAGAPVPVTRAQHEALTFRSMPRSRRLREPEEEDPDSDDSEEDQPANRNPERPQFANAPPTTAARPSLRLGQQRRSRKRLRMNDSPVDVHSPNVPLVIDLTRDE